MIPEIDENAPPAEAPHYSLWTMRGRTIAKLSRPDGKRGKPTGIYKDTIAAFGERAKVSARPDHRGHLGQWHMLGEALRWFDVPGYVAAFHAADRIVRGCDVGAVLRAFALLVASLPVTEWVRCRDVYSSCGRDRWEERARVKPGFVVCVDAQGEYLRWPEQEARREASGRAMYATIMEHAAEAPDTSSALDRAAQWGRPGKVLA